MAIVWEPQSIDWSVLLPTSAGAIPGKSLVVLDPDLGLAIDIFPCEDGYTQERALLSEVLPTVEAGDLWIGERNFCTTGFIFGIESQQAFFKRAPTSKPSLDSPLVNWFGLVTLTGERYLSKPE